MNRRTLISGLGSIALVKMAKGVCGASINGPDATARLDDDLPITSNRWNDSDAFKLELLPILRSDEQSTHQFCSYDRAGDNYDFDYFPLYMESNGECVIFDAFGPGCLCRLHMNI